MPSFIAWLVALVTALTSYGAPATPPADPPATTARVPYAGGHLVADDRWFEGTNGLRLVRHGHVVASWCSSGAPIRSRGLVAWVTLLCPESGDVTGTVLHRARVDGSHHVRQRLARRPDTSGSARLLRLRGDVLVYRSIDGAVWRTDLVAPPQRIRAR